MLADLDRSSEWFLLFTLLWGDTGCPGIGQYLAWLAKHRRLTLLTQALIPGMAGKLAGLGRFLTQRGNGETARTSAGGSGDDTARGGGRRG